MQIEIVNHGIGFGLERFLFVVLKAIASAFANVEAVCRSYGVDEIDITIPGNGD